LPKHLLKVAYFINPTHDFLTTLIGGEKPPFLPFFFGPLDDSFCLGLICFTENSAQGIDENFEKGFTVNS
jgi:hypothetical protein